MDVPSRHTVAAELGPTEVSAPTVYLISPVGVVPNRLREELVDYVARQLHDIAELVPPRASQVLKHAFAAYEFKAGILPHVARQLVADARAWFFQNLADFNGRRQEGRRRKARRKALSLMKRKERRQVKRDLGRFCGATPHRA